MERTGGKSPPTKPCSPGSQKSQGRAHRQPLEFLSSGTMNWQGLWLGFLLPMTVSGRALGPAGKEAAVVSSTPPHPGKRNPGRDRGAVPQSHPGLPPDLQCASPFLPLLHDLLRPISLSLPLFHLSPFPKVSLLQSLHVCPLLALWMC